LSIACSNRTAAQSVLGPFTPPGASLFDSGSTGKFSEPKGFGTEITQLPGQRVGSADIRGKWAHSHSRRNVEFEKVRMPQMTVAMLLDLQADGRYTLDYRVDWGTVGNSPEGRYASLEVTEAGRHTVSGSVLLLEADSTQISRRVKGKPSVQTLSKQRRAYVARLDKATLNIAGPCARYQVEDVCLRHRNVWFSLPQLSATAARIGR
jgi:hypothetical protein